MSLLSLIPSWAWFAALTAAIAGGGVWHTMAVHEAYSEGMAKVQALWNEADKRAMEKARLAEEAARAEEQRRTTAQQGIINDALRRVKESAAAASAADGAAQRLRERAASLAARCSGSAGNPTVAGPSQAASAPGVVLADVLGRLESAGRELAAVATARGIAGAACERSYDSLNK